MQYVIHIPGNSRPEYHLEVKDMLKAFCRIFALRHVERNKNHPSEDKQIPTLGGEIAAYAMGQWVREQHHPNLVRCVCTPQPRSRRTANVLLHGISGFDKKSVPEIPDHGRLNDYSTDPRDIIKDALKAGKEFSALNKIEIEHAALIFPPFKEALDLKVGEAMQVMDELKETEGDHGMLGLHGGTIDAMYVRLKAKLNPEFKALVPEGGIFGKVEGWVAEFDSGGNILSIEQIRQPAELRAYGQLKP